MADEESKSSLTGGGSERPSYRFRTRDEDSKKSAMSSDPAPPWAADRKPRTRPSPRPRPASPPKETNTPKWGAQSTLRTRTTDPSKSPSRTFGSSPSKDSSSETPSWRRGVSPYNKKSPTETPTNKPSRFRGVSPPTTNPSTEASVSLSSSEETKDETSEDSVAQATVTIATPDVDTFTLPEPSVASVGEAMIVQEPEIEASTDEPIEATFTLGSVTVSTDETPSVAPELVEKQLEEKPTEEFKAPEVKTTPEVPMKTPEVVMTTPEVAKTTPGVTKTTPEVAKTMPGVTKTTPEVLKKRPEVLKKPPEVLKKPPEVLKKPEVVQRKPVAKEPEKPTTVPKSEPVPKPAPVQVAKKPEPAKVQEKTEVDDKVLKQWEVEANNGSEEHQLNLGKHFLSLADLDIAREQNAGRSLDWLIKASKQGNEEATTLLKSCVDRNLPGVETRDAHDIKWCLTTSSYEKKIRNGARNLFNKINTTHKDAISRDEYMAAIKGITGKIGEQKLLMAAGKKIGKEISENEFVKMLSMKIQGTVTLTSQELTDTNVSYESAGYLTRVIRYPRQTAASVMDQALEYSSTEGLNWVVSLIPTNQLYVLGLLFVYSFITQDFLFFFVPLFIFYLSFAAIIICTLQMFYKRKKQKDAATLANVLKEFDVSIDLDKTESQYTWNSLTPYIVFFSNLPITIASFSLSHKSYIPCAEISVISLVMTGLCFFSLSDHHDKLTFFALFANLLSSLPIFLHNFPTIPVLTQAVGLICNPFVTLDTGLGIKFNVGLPSIAYIAIPIFFASMAMRKSWEGTYRILIPHLVCYFWFNITTSTFPYTSWIGLARATVGYLLLPLVLPLSVVGVFVMAAFAIYKAFQTEMLGKIVVTLILLSVPILMTQSKKIFGKNFEAKFGIAKKVIMVIFAILAVVPLIFVKIPTWKKEVPVELSYENYTQLCFREKVVNDVPQQITCSHLEGTKIKWIGTVEGVTVTKIENTAESVLSSLPSVIAKPLYCMYGQEYPQCDRKLLSKKGYSFCTVMRGLGHTCHVKNHNVYNFEILALTESQNIKIQAGDQFKETVLALEIGDTIEYKGVLKDNLGGTVSTVKLSSLRTTNRDLPIMKKIDDDADLKMLNAVHEAMAVAFNFLWYPLLEFTVED